MVDGSESIALIRTSQDLFMINLESMEVIHLTVIVSDHSANLVNELVELKEK